MKRVCAEFSLDPSAVPAARHPLVISQAKSELMTPEDFAPRRPATTSRRSSRALYERYQALLTENNALDFDDILMETVELLRDDAGRAREATATATRTCWSTSSRTPTSRSTCSRACWRRRPTPTSASSATRTSRSTPGARPTSATSSTSSATIPKANDRAAGAELPLAPRPSSTARTKIIAGEQAAQGEEALDGQRGKGDPIVVYEAYNEEEEAVLRRARGQAPAAPGRPAPGRYRRHVPHQRAVARD